MNLIQDRWIPVRRKSGAIVLIAPWEITDRHFEDPVVGLAAPRPDFNGALIQFLIGLLQTTSAPINVLEWREKFAAPPSGDELQKTLSSVAIAFELDGDGPRFMQDLTLFDEFVSKKAQESSKPIEQLLVDGPGDITLRNNTDHFIKRDACRSLCRPCAAAALFSAHLNAPGSGRGYRTGIRGGSPLTTLLCGDDLWTTCWLNVLDEHDFLASRENLQRFSICDRFPWLTVTRTSEHDEKMTPEDCHPDQINWAMPLRVHLLFEEGMEGLSCDVCGSENTVMARRFYTTQYGVNYYGPWKHPLSPNLLGPDRSPKPWRITAAGIGYRHWLGMVISEVQPFPNREPAKVVERFLRYGDQDLRLWAFSYSMKKAKALSWCESTMPLLNCAEDVRQDYESRLRSVLLASELTSDILNTRVKKVFFRPGVKMRGDLSFVTGRFWRETEAAFYEIVKRLRDALTAGADVIPMLSEWHRVLLGAVERIFDDVSQSGSFGAADAKRIAIAWNDLKKTLNGRKMRETLGLPVEQNRKPRKKSPRRKDGGSES